MMGWPGKGVQGIVGEDRGPGVKKLVQGVPVPGLGVQGGWVPVHRNEHSEWFQGQGNRGYRDWEEQDGRFKRSPLSSKGESWVRESQDR